MIKRRLYKQDHGDKDEVSDSSSSSSSSDSESEPEEEEEETEVAQEEVDMEAVQEPYEDAKKFDSPSSGSGYESEDSSGNEVEDDPSEEALSNIKEDSTEADSSYWILKSKSVFKCRLCPRIVCLTEESLRAHLKSKRHARSEKLLKEGRLKFMLNSDGEIEEDQETHAERHARTVALAQDSTNKKNKNKGRQRQRLRLKRKTMGDGPDKAKAKRLTKNPSKKRRKDNN